MTAGEQKKPGMFSRLFGRGDNTPDPEPAEQAPASDPAQSAESRDRNAISVSPPDSTAEALDGTPPPHPSGQLDKASETEPSQESAATTSPDESAPQPAAATLEPEQPKQGWFQRLKSGLSKTSSRLTEGITSVFTKRKLDAESLDDLEDLLIQADLGVDTAMRITERISSGRYDKGISPEEVREILAGEVEAVLAPVASELTIDPGNKPHVILMVGVNGTGKTTTIGKLAAKFRADGKKVLLVAGDTFRAAAIEQLQVWGERVGCEVMKREVGADAAGLGFDALTRAKAEGYEIVMMDTAGRLQNKAGLMDELEKGRPRHAQG